MPACHTARADARRFVTTPYVDGGDGRLVPLLPDEGPCGGDGRRCRLRVDHYRNRKTGPEFPLAVLRCSAHGRRGFTAYPAGYVPYGRQRVAPVATDGSALHVPGEGVAPMAMFAVTAFAPAVDAAAGKAWAREAGGPWWSTQGRWLARLVGWLGVAVDLDAAVRARIAAILGVAQLLLLEQAMAIAAQPGYRQRGLAVVAVLTALRRDASLADRLVAAGAEVGLWPHARRWHPELGQLRDVGLGSRAPRAAPLT